MLANTADHDADVHAWAEEQAALLRAGRLSDVDADHLANEIEQLGRQLRQEVEERLGILLVHLIRWEYQRGLRGPAWELTVSEQRLTLAELLEESPSLADSMTVALYSAYETALARAALETNWPPDVFPWACKWSVEQVLDDAFWPEPD